MIEALLFCQIRYFSFVKFVIFRLFCNMENKIIRKIRKYVVTLCACCVSLTAMAQGADYNKMSQMLRSLTMAAKVASRSDKESAQRMPPKSQRQVCAFVRLADDDDQVLERYGARSLARFGRIHIASIPIGSLGPLSLSPSVVRMEARQGNSIHMDTTTVLMGGAKAHEGRALPQAFTGRGVMVGVEDIGFDLTHPNFYDETATHYRIKRFWDFLSTDTVGSTLFVGAEYTTEEALKNYAHSRDGFIQSHGTHTLGSAAGSGYRSPYKGMAPEADICLVSNAVSEDLELIDSADVDKFTYATDCLGFKYMFDYADQMGMPCVVSFSEGSSMDFRGDDQLYYEVLDSLTGPGHILVASAGNGGQQVSHIRKPLGTEKASVAVISGGKGAYFSIKGSNDDYTLRLRLQGTDEQQVEYPIRVEDVYQLADTLLSDTLSIGEKPYYITATCYPSCFNEAENVMEVVLMTDEKLGQGYYVGFDVLGAGTDVEVFKGSGYLVPQEGGIGDNACSVHSPGSAPSVICVGATGYRTGFINYLGEYHEYNQGTGGARSPYSSVGPTYDGRIKPDVMAPGTNVISSYSSYYLEASPNADDISSDVEHFEFQGRTYAWNANSGTSMATPVVAGAIALWLQAKPDLSPEDVMEVIRKTSRRHDPSLEYPNNLYGYGEVDAYAGLLELLGIEGIEGLSSHAPQKVAFLFDDQQRLHLLMDEKAETTVWVRVFDRTGALVQQQRLMTVDGRASLSLSVLPRGIYAIQVDGPDPYTTGSTLIRR